MPHPTRKRSEAVRHPKPTLYLMKKCTRRTVVKNLRQKTFSYLSTGGISATQAPSAEPSSKLPLQNFYERKLPCSIQSKPHAPKSKVYPGSLVNLKHVMALKTT